MNNDDLKNKIFVGVVVDNVDPDRVGRVKVNVMNVFDTIPTEDIPFATPFKDLNGNEYSVPDVGKVVSVIFDNGNSYMPEYIYAEHYNINIENKLKALSDSDTLSFKSVYMDHQTQIYRTDSEGLKIDHEYTNINLDPNGNILLNIRDPNSIITMGSSDAAEEAVLGTTFMTWMDSLIENLLGSNGGPYLGNLGAPVTPNPALLECLQTYQDQRTNFVSAHVKISKNGSVKSQSRPYVAQYGDSYTTNVGTTLVTRKTPSYTPTSDYTPSQPSIENPATMITLNDLGNETPGPSNSVNNPIDPKTTKVLWKCSIYNQGDPNWGNISDGTTTIRKAGCCLCSYAMYASAFKSINATPLNFFDANGRSVVVYWDTIRTKYSFPSPSQFYNCDQTKLDGLLINGPVMWESKNKPKYVHGSQHWMLIVGKNLDGTYIVNDPNGGLVRTNVPISDILTRLGRLKGLTSPQGANSAT